MPLWARIAVCYHAIGFGFAYAVFAFAFLRGSVRPVALLVIGVCSAKLYAGAVWNQTLQSPPRRVSVILRLSFDSCSLSLALSLYLAVVHGSQLDGSRIITHSTAPVCTAKRCLHDCTVAGHYPSVLLHGQEARHCAYTQRCQDAIASSSSNREAHYVPPTVTMKMQ
jgi:hypothetical protein